MEFYVEWRLKGDYYFDSFGNGFTLSRSESVQKMEKMSQDEDKTVFKGVKGHEIVVKHQKCDGVTKIQTSFTNKTSESSRLELLSSFAIKGIKADRIHRATSFWSAEGKLLSQDITELDMEVSWAKHGIRIEKYGQLGSMPVRKFFPFLALEDTETGHIIGIQLYIASSWQIEVMNKEGDLFIQGGIADRDYGDWYKDIAPGETFEAPCAVMAEGESLYEVCDKLVKAQHPRIASADKDMPVIFNEWCTSWGSPSFEMLEKIAKRLEGSGVKYLVIDDGWYKNKPDDDWYTTTGDWNQCKAFYPGGIREAADMIRSHGLIPGIWFEYENVGTTSKAAEEFEHLQKRDGDVVTVGARRFWDMRQKWVKEYLDRKVIDLLKEGDFGYLKVDYNENYGAGVDGAESYGEAVRQSVVASQDYFRHISEELPDLVIENCSSGGHRLEPSMMELVSMASFSDAHEAKSIPLIAANLHRLIRPEQSQIWAVLRAKDDIHRLNYTLSSTFLGRLCLSGDIFDLTDEQWDRALEAIKFYDKIKHIIRDGYTGVIETNVKDYSKPSGYQIVMRTLGKEALLIVHTFENGANPPVEKYMADWKIVDEYGSELDGDFRGKAYLLTYFQTA